MRLQLEFLNRIQRWNQRLSLEHDVVGIDSIDVVRRIGSTLSGNLKPVASGKVGPIEVSQDVRDRVDGGRRQQGQCLIVAALKRQALELVFLEMQTDGRVIRLNQGYGRPHFYHFTGVAHRQRQINAQPGGHVQLGSGLYGLLEACKHRAHTVFSGIQKRHHVISRIVRDDSLTHIGRQVRHGDGYARNHQSALVRDGAQDGASDELGLHHADRQQSRH